MKFLVISLFVLVFGFSVFGQQAQKPDDYMRPTFVQRTSLHKLLPKMKNAVVFLGDSITYGGEWGELLNCPKCQNRGISGDISAGILARLGDILAEKPAKIFLMIGINDISRGIPNDTIIANYREFIRRTKAESPKTRIYLQSVLPTNDTFRKFVDKNDESITALNDAMREIAKADRSITYIDLYKGFLDKDGRLEKSYTYDGLHLLGEGYAHWAKLVRESGAMK